MATIASCSAGSSYLLPTSPTSSSSSSRVPSFPVLPITRRRSRIVAMATKKKVNKYDAGWTKQWFGAGLFAEVSEEVEFDIVKELEKKKVLSKVEKAGLLSKADELGFTLSSIEKLGFFSKAEELGLLSLAEKAAGFSPDALASISLPLLVASLAVIALVPDDSTALVVGQTVVAGVFAVGAVGLFVGSIVLGGLQESD